MKKNKVSVQYTDHAMNHDERCKVCKFYLAHGAVTAYPIKGPLCKKVKGVISPNGWCKLFERSERT